MPKQLLTGSLEEQCDFLYQLAQEKMQIGNYTGAIHALDEVVKHAPDYADAADLLALAKRRKTDQRNRLLFALIGAALFIGIGTFAQVTNDLWLFALAFLGLLVGYGVANLVSSLRT
ncbi:MAG: hypothetical protein R2873_05785 [Caldilineaceae bacterium]|nr:hypothetical protein [Caldilineaceae bacterium]